MANDVEEAGLLAAINEDIRSLESEKTYTIEEARQRSLTPSQKHVGGDTGDGFGNPFRGTNNPHRLQISLQYSTFRPMSGSHEIVPKHWESNGAYQCNSTFLPYIVVIHS